MLRGKSHKSTAHNASELGVLRDLHTAPRRRAEREQNFYERKIMKFMFVLPEHTVHACHEHQQREESFR